MWHSRRVTAERLLTERGLRVSQGPADRVAYAADLWPRRLIERRAGQREPGPQAIVWPKSAEEVSTVLEVARSEGVPVVPYGAGSGVCGGITPDRRTWVVDLKAMNDWRIDPEGPVLDAGPGVVGITLEDALLRRGFTVGHFPSSILCSTVGGWVAARGAGQCSGRYGKIEDMVVSLDAILGSGQALTAKRRLTGPDLVPLFVGSEGTVGVLTRVRLRLHPAPSERAFAAFTFPNIALGWEAMRAIFQAGLRPSVSRLYDPLDSLMLRQGRVHKADESAAAAAPSVAASHAAAGASRPSPKARLLRALLGAPRVANAAIALTDLAMRGASTLVLVFEGAPEEVTADAARARALCSGLRGRDLGEGPARRWLEHRYSVSYRQAPIFRMGAFSDTMEVAAPWSRLAGLYDAVRRHLGKRVVVMAHLSHAYPDGCSIYFTFAGATKSDAEALALYDDIWRTALEVVVAAGGTISHHHGVGRSKSARLGDELGHGVEVVRGLLRAWDPEGIMNPGNLVPPVASAEAVIAPPALGLDRVSRLATLDGAVSVARAERELLREGLSLGLAGAAPETSVDAWIAHGMPGKPEHWADPVGQVAAGFSARLASGEALVVRPAPRRAVGPDLFALFRAGQGAAGTITTATLPVVPRDGAAARALPFSGERDPALSEAERAAWQSALASTAAR